MAEQLPRTRAELLDALLIERFAPVPRPATAPGRSVRVTAPPEVDDELTVARRRKILDAALSPDSSYPARRVA